MADNTIDGFLNSLGGNSEEDAHKEHEVHEVHEVHEEHYEHHEEQKPKKERRSRKNRGISNLSGMGNGFLTVGGGQVLMEFEDKGTGGKIDDEDLTGQNEEKPDKSEANSDNKTYTNSTQDTQSTQSSQGTQSTSSPHHSEREDKTPDTQSVANNSDSAQSLTSEVSLLSRKIDRLISIDKILQTSVEGVKSSFDSKSIEVIIQNEFASLVESLRTEILDIKRSFVATDNGADRRSTGTSPDEVLTEATKEVPAGGFLPTISPAESSIPGTGDGEMVSREDYEALAKEKEAVEEFLEKARNTVQKLANEIGSKDEQIERLRSESDTLRSKVEELTVENQKMRTAIGEHIKSRNGTNAAVTPQNTTRDKQVPPISNTSHQSQNVYEVHNAYNVQNGQQVQNPQQSSNGSQIIGQFANSDTSYDPWGGAAPPAVDLMAEPDKPKKKGLFGKKK